MNNMQVMITYFEHHEYEKKIDWIICSLKGDDDIQKLF